MKAELLNYTENLSIVSSLQMEPALGGLG